MKKVYLAGPMRGYPDWNFDRFKAVVDELRSKGYQVFSPAEGFENLGYEKGEYAWTDRAHLEHVMMLDIAHIFAADILVVLNGWEYSKGCLAEVALADFLNKPVYNERMSGVISLVKPVRHSIQVKE